jgi:hypothetical protein
LKTGETKEERWFDRPLRNFLDISVKKGDWVIKRPAHTNTGVDVVKIIFGVLPPKAHCQALSRNNEKIMIYYPCINWQLINLFAPKQI